MNIECPHNSTPQVGDKIPSHFSTIEAYQKWRADIEPTIEKMKHDIFPRRDAGIHDYGYYNLGVPSPPPPRFGFSGSAFVAWLSGQIPYHILTRWHPMPILLKQDRFFLEYKLYRIKKYIDLAHPIIKDCMTNDMNLILAGLAWREKVYNILRENFPDLPLEYAENPAKYGHQMSVIFWGIFTILLFPDMLISFDGLTGLNLSDAFNLMPLAVVLSFAELAADSPEANHFILTLSFTFYFAFICAIWRYIDPPLDVRYDTPWGNKIILYPFIISCGIIAPNYIYPPILTLLLVKMPSVFTAYFIIAIEMLAWGTVGAVLGTLAFKLKQRFENSSASE